MNDLDHKAQCEAEHGTAHLPENVRASIYRNTNWEMGYEDAAEIALMAWSAARRAIKEKLSEFKGERYTTDYIINCMDRGVI